MLARKGCVMIGRQEEKTETFPKEGKARFSQEAASRQRSS